MLPPRPIRGAGGAAQCKTWFLCGPQSLGVWVFGSGFASRAEVRSLHPSETPSSSRGRHDVTVHGSGLDAILNDERPCSGCCGSYEFQCRGGRRDDFFLQCSVGSMVVLGLSSRPEVSPVQKPGCRKEARAQPHDPSQYGEPAYISKNIPSADPRKDILIRRPMGAPCSSQASTPIASWLYARPPSGNNRADRSDGGLTYQRGASSPERVQSAAHAPYLHTRNPANYLLGNCFPAGGNAFKLECHLPIPLHTYPDPAERTS
jgi:hypothetical protein